MTPFEHIQDLLSEVDYELHEHGHIITVADAEAATGTPARNHVKSILFKVGDGFKLIVIRGDNRADFRKLNRIFETNKLRLAKPEEVEQHMRVKIGACYPFGEVANVETHVDDTIAELDVITFSPGTHNHSITMNYADYEKVTKPQLIDVVKT